MEAIYIMKKHLKIVGTYPASWTKDFLTGFNLVMILGYVLFLQGCRNTDQVIADTILYNGKVISVDSGFGIYSGVAIKDGKILAVGSDEKVLSVKGANTHL